MDKNINELGEFVVDGYNVQHAVESFRTIFRVHNAEQNACLNLNISSGDAASIASRLVSTAQNNVQFDAVGNTQSIINLNFASLTDTETMKAFGLLVEKSTLFAMVGCGILKFDLLEMTKDELLDVANQLTALAHGM